MKIVNTFWRKITHGKDLDEAGPLEKAFFESVYRLSYITGLSTSDVDIKYTIYSSTVRILSALVVICEIWRVLGDNLSLDEIISCINVISIHMITIWKLMIMVSNKDVYKKLAKAMEFSDISTSNRKKIVDRWVNTHRKYLKVLMTLSCLTLAVWYTYPLVDEVEYNLITDVKVPIAYHTPTRYAITYVVVGIMFNYASFLVIMSEVIMQAYLIPLICQYAVLADCFENLLEECAVEFEGIKQDLLVKDTKFKEKYLARLSELVRKHRLILDQSMDLKAILSAPMLGQLACSGLLICFVGYQATTTIAHNLGKFIMTFLYLGYNMFTLYLICRWCEEVTVQSQRIGEAAYFSGWESGISQVPGVRATMILVIARANKPVVFLAGGMYTLSLSSFTNLVKASYSALNILLRMSHE
ncbi:odorant receptor 13a-like [Trichoplusia ni]|uniref:Odorant receptor n=1 Tax=Trichoplusia ni TaxID=7111 RepID=A0A7E5W9G1_TRINI|nr:odorant receptor 13a-like [Trichoplusia ni]